MNKKTIQQAILIELEERTFEDILEDFDISPEDVFWDLYKAGQIDNELFEKLYLAYE